MLDRVLWILLLRDGQPGVATGGGRGEAHEKTTFLILTGPRELGVKKGVRGHEFHQVGEAKRTHAKDLYWESGRGTQKKVWGVSLVHLNVSESQLGG